MSNDGSPSGFQAPRFHHRWYLREWMAERGKRQRDMIADLGWSKGKANEVANGQQYTQALIDVLAPWLDIEPHELLMPPTLANSIRKLKQSAELIVAETARPFQPDGLEDIQPTRKIAG